MGRTGLTKEEREKLTAVKEEKRFQRIKKREKRALSGGSFKAQEPHLIYPSPSSFRRAINAYFTIQEKESKPQTVPGLALFLGMRTKTLMGYEPSSEYAEYKQLSDYAIQRVEAFMAGKLTDARGSTKGIEFLASNTLGYANKSEVKSNITAELTEKEKLKQTPTEELLERARNLLPKLGNVVNFPLSRPDEE